MGYIRNILTLGVNGVKEEGRGMEGTSGESLARGTRVVPLERRNRKLEK